MELELEWELELELEWELERARRWGCGLGLWLWLLAGLGGGSRTAGRLPRHPAGRCAAGGECAGGLRCFRAARVGPPGGRGEKWQMGKWQMANSDRVVGGWMRGRVVVVVRGERGAARGRVGEMKTVVGLVPEAGTGTCCASGNLRAPLAGRGGKR